MGSLFSYISYMYVHVQCKYMYVPSKEYGDNFMLIYMCVIQK